MFSTPNQSAYASSSQRSCDKIRRVPLLDRTILAPPIHARTATNTRHHSNRLRGTRDAGVGGATTPRKRSPRSLQDCGMQMISLFEANTTEGLDLLLHM